MKLHSTFLERKRAFIEGRRHVRPTLDELRQQAEEALRAERGEDLGRLSHEKRNKILFGL